MLIKINILKGLYLRPGKRYLDGKVNRKDYRAANMIRVHYTHENIIMSAYLKGKCLRL